MVNTIKLRYEGVQHDVFEFTFIEHQTGLFITRRVAGKKLREKLLDKSGHYTSKFAKQISRTICHFLSDEEAKKSLDEIECMLFCMHNKLEDMGECWFKDKKGGVWKYIPVERGSIEIPGI